MSVQNLYAKLFERIRQIRLDEMQVVFHELDGRRFRRGLEIGCGDGTQSILLAQICDELISTDIDSSDIPAERLQKITFQAADAQSLPFPDGHFDLVFSSNVLEHIDNLEIALEEMQRVLSSDGIMIHVLPNAVWKFLQINLWIPFRFKVLWTKMVGKSVNSSEIGDFGDQKHQQKRVQSKWFPPIHGNSKSHLQEFLVFRVGSWKRIFVKHGFEIEKSFGVRLYSAWNVGPAFMREILERFGLKSSHCFFIKKKL